MHSSLRRRPHKISHFSGAGVTTHWWLVGSAAALVGFADGLIGRSGVVVGGRCRGGCWGVLRGLSHLSLEDGDLHDINWLNGSILFLYGVLLRAAAYAALTLCNREKMGKPSWGQLCLMCVARCAVP